VLVFVMEPILAEQARSEAVNRKQKKGKARAHVTKCSRIDIKSTPDQNGGSTT